MTDKLYLMTEAQRDLMDEAYKTLFKHRDAYAVQCAYEGKDNTIKSYELLQSLPMVSDEPVCWLFKTEEDSELGILPYTVIAETEHGAGIREMLGAFQVYTSPQPLTPITADMVTPAMYNEWQKVFGESITDCPKDSEIMATAYNVIRKHRSEAK